MVLGNQITPTLNCPCGEENKVERICFTKKPIGETDFNISDKDYVRYYDQCLVCNHWFGRHKIDLSNLYSGSYVAATYGKTLDKTFDKIVNLDPSKSDNAGRAFRIHSFCQTRFKPGKKLTNLDIGSGTGVFSYAMKNLGWQCTAIDPDPVASEHIAKRVRINSICGDFLTMDYEKIGSFDLITFNKVLEHVENPLEMLVKGTSLLQKYGLIYVEVPDGDSAYQADPAHEEFFIEHHHAFSLPSLTLMVERSGLKCLEIKRIVDPSGKFTLYCFATNKK